MNKPTEKQRTAILYVVLIALLAYFIWDMVTPDGGQPKRNYKAERDSIQALYNKAVFRYDSLQQAMDGEFSAIDCTFAGSDRIDTLIKYIPQKYAADYITVDTLDMYQLPEYVSRQLDSITFE